VSLETQLQRVGLHRRSGDTRSRDGELLLGALGALPLRDSSVREDGVVVDSVSSADATRDQLAGVGALRRASGQSANF